MIVCDCKYDHVTAALFMSELSSIMSLLISDTQIKAKILPGDHAFSFCVPKLRNDSLVIKMSSLSDFCHGNNKNGRYKTNIAN